MGQTRGFLPQIFKTHFLIEPWHAAEIFYMVLFPTLYVGFEVQFVLIFGRDYTKQCLHFLSQQTTVNQLKKQHKRTLCRSLWFMSMFTGCHTPQVFFLLFDFDFAGITITTGLCQLLLKWELKV